MVNYTHLLAWIAGLVVYISATWCSSNIICSINHNWYRGEEALKVMGLN